VLAFPVVLLQDTSEGFLSRRCLLQGKMSFTGFLYGKGVWDLAFAFESIACH
jgi:hypothetical protein